MPNEDELTSIPDFSRMVQLPWEPKIAWIPSDNHFQGKPYPLNTRVALQLQLEEAAKLGFSVAVVPKANLPKKGDKAFEGLTVHGVERNEQAKDVERGL
jgi:hypothetical protein